MNPTLAAGLAGAVAAGGVWMCAYALRRPTLAEVLADPPQPPPRPVRGPGWMPRLGAAGAPLLEAVGLPTARVRRDLAAADADTNAYLAEKTLATAAGIAVPAVLALLLAATSTPVHPLMAAATALMCVVACWLAPDLAAHSRAASHRADLTAATSILADLVVISLAGGAGISGALTSASQRGHGWAAGRIRLALHTATLTGQPQWKALSDLAERTGVPALRELAGSLQLAGTDGARIRASLTAKAASLRARESSAAEAHANSATERMTLPVMGLVGGFFLLILFPAISHISTGF